jgi:hypothetical protein
MTFSGRFALNQVKIATAAAMVVSGSCLGAAASAQPVATTTTTRHTTRHTISPATMRRGAAPSTYYLASRRIHTGSGRVIRLPRSWVAGDLQLVGKSPRGYIVDRGDFAGKRGRIYRVTARSVRLVSSHPASSRVWWWYLSQGGRRIIGVSEQPYSCTDMVVLNLSGRRLAHKCAGPVDYLGSSNSSIWFQAQYGAKPVQWQYSTGAVSTAGHFAGVLADTEHQVLFVDTSREGTAVGPTSLKSPGTPSWTADFTPMAISPRGTYVAGVAHSMFYDGSDGADIEIRRMSDGRVVARFHYRGSVNWTYEMWWDSPSAVLVSVGGRKYSYLVRCRTSGVCRLAASRLPAGMFFTHDPQTDFHDSSN